VSPASKPFQMRLHPLWLISSSAGGLSDAPSVTNADSFFIVLSAADALAMQSNLPSFPTTTAALPPMETAAWSSLDRQKRDESVLSPLVSPPFVLAPRGLNLALVEALPSTSNTAQNTQPTTALQAQPANTSSTEKARPVSWGNVAAPILIVLTVGVICGLIFAHRRGKRSALSLAKTQAREGEEKWREATHQEVEDLAKSTASQAAQSVTRLPIVMAAPPRSAIPIASRPDPVGRYALLPSELGCNRQERSIPPPTLQRTATVMSTSSYGGETCRHSMASGRALMRTGIPYHPAGDQSWSSSTVSRGESRVPLLSRRESTCSSAATITSSLSAVLLAPLIPSVLRPRSTSSHAAPLIPSVLRPRSISSHAALVNPFEECKTQSSTPRPASLPTLLPSAYRQLCQSRVFSSNAAERSQTTGRLGTAFASIGQETLQRADESNDLYLQLRRSLQRPLPLPSSSSFPS
jgi:hypothetical protein